MSVWANLLRVFLVESFSDGLLPPMELHRLVLVLAETLAKRDSASPEISLFPGSFGTQIRCWYPEKSWDLLLWSHCVAGSPSSALPALCGRKLLRWGSSSHGCCSKRASFSKIESRYLTSSHADICRFVEQKPHPQPEVRTCPPCIWWAYLWIRSRAGVSGCVWRRCHCLFPLSWRHLGTERLACYSRCSLPCWEGISVSSAGSPGSCTCPPAPAFCSLSWCTHTPRHPRCRMHCGFCSFGSWSALAISCWSRAAPTPRYISCRLSGCVSGWRIARGLVTIYS